MTESTGLVSSVLADASVIHWYMGLPTALMREVALHQARRVRAGVGRAGRGHSR